MATSLKAIECHVTPVVSASYILSIIKEADIRLIAATSNVCFLATFCGTGLYLSRDFFQNDIIFLVVMIISRRIEYNLETD